MGSVEKPSSGPLQTRQSEGNAVVTRSSKTERSAELAQPATLFLGRIRTRPSSDPAPGFGGAPGKSWSVLSFRLTLKMHLAHTALQAAWAAPMAEV
jgi:hypothetical protein